MPAGAAGPAQTNAWDDAHAALKRLDYQKAEEGLGAIRDSPFSPVRNKACHIWGERHILSASVEALDDI